MAEILKPKDLAKVLEAIPENQVASAAEELGVTSKQLSGFIKKPTSKAFQKIAETLGEGIEGAQKFVNKFIGREPTELEKVGTKAAQGGVEPPKVQPEFAKEELGKERGFQLPGQPGGPLVTTQPPAPPAVISKAPEIPEQTGRLATLGSKLEQAGATEVGPKLLPAGKAAESTMTKAPLQTAMEAAQAPKMSMAKKAGAVSAGLLGLAGLYNLQKASEVVKQAEIDRPEDTAVKIDQAVNTPNALDEQKQQVLQDQSQKIAQVSKSIEELLQEAKDEKRAGQARLELLRLTETVMQGLVTALGANALLNKNSPFAVDFSQGPRVDWNAQFDRLQKDFDSQMGFLTKKYELEEAGKRAAAREEQRRAERAEDVAFRERKFAAEQGAKAATAAEAQEKKKETAIASATGIIEKIAALDKEKDSQQLATARGQLYKQAKAILQPDELKQVEARATELFDAEKSIWKKFFSDIGIISKEPSKKEYGQMTDAFARALNEKINPVPEMQGQPAPAPMSDREAKLKRLQELEAKQKGG